MSAGNTLESLTRVDSEPLREAGFMDMTVFEFFWTLDLHQLEGLLKSFPEEKKRALFIQYYIQLRELIIKSPCLETWKKILQLEILSIRIALSCPATDGDNTDQLQNLALATEYQRLIANSKINPIAAYRDILELNKQYPTYQIDDAVQQQIIELRNTVFSLRFQSLCDQFAQNPDLPKYTRVIDFINKIELTGFDTAEMRSRLPDMYRIMVGAYSAITEKPRQVEFDTRSLKSLLDCVPNAQELGIEIRELTDLIPQLEEKAHQAVVWQKLADLRTDRTIDNLRALELAVDQTQNHNARIPHCDRLLAKERKYTMRYLIKIYVKHIREVSVEESRWLYFDGFRGLKHKIQLARESGVNVAEVEAQLPKLAEIALRKEYAYCLSQLHDDAQSYVRDFLNFLMNEARKLGINLDEEELIRR